MTAIILMIAIAVGLLWLAAITISTIEAAPRRHASRAGSGLHRHVPGVVRNAGSGVSGAAGLGFAAGLAATQLNRDDSWSEDSFADTHNETDGGSGYSSLHDRLFDSDNSGPLAVHDTALGDPLADFGTDINPANGMPMIGGIGGVDVEGNPYGTDGHSDSFDSSFDSSFSSWDD